MNVFLWEFYTCYFNYTDVEYGELNLFKQPDKGMDFVLRHVKVMCTIKQLTFSFHRYTYITGYSYSYTVAMCLQRFIMNIYVIS